MAKAFYLHLKAKSVLPQLMGIDPEVFLNVNSCSVKVYQKKLHENLFFFSYNCANWWALKFAHIKRQKKVITFLSWFFFVKK